MMKFFNSEQSTVDQIAKTDLKHVLVMQLDDPGAVVMLSPALRALRAFLPHARLTLMTSEAGSQLAHLLPWIDEWKRVLAGRKDHSPRAGSNHPAGKPDHCESFGQHAFC